MSKRKTNERRKPKKTTEQFKKEVYDIVGDKISVMSEYTHGREHVKFHCNVCGHDFLRYPEYFLGGRNECPECKKHKRGKPSCIKKTTEEFKKEVYNLYKDEYTVMEEYKGSKQKILIRHNICGHKFRVRPTFFLEGNKCPECYGIKKKTTKEFKKEVKELFGNEYTVLDEYVNTFTKIRFKHNKCGTIFEMSPDHFRNTEIPCPKERKEYNRDKSRITTEEFAKRLKEKQGDEYEVVGDYTDCRTKIKLRHNKCGHEWYVAPYNAYSLVSCPICAKDGRPSELELEVLDYIKSIYDGEIIHSNKTILHGLELDIVIPEFMLAIEIDGLYWHCDKFKDKNYHLHKTTECNELGYRLIHIYEDEWKQKNKIVKDKLKNMLNLTSKRIYARNCYIKEISSDKKKHFLEKYHIQGNDKSCINLGLFRKDTRKLVSVMTFCKPRTSLGQKGNSIYDYELSRYVTKMNYSVVGGFSKLLTYFEKNYTWKKIITYADKRWSVGNLYLKNGFTLLRESKPSYWYADGNNRYHRFNFRKGNLKKLFPDLYEDDLTEFEIMDQTSYRRIYDCGNYVFEYDNRFI